MKPSFMDPHGNVWRWDDGAQLYWSRLNGHGVWAADEDAARNGDTATTYIRIRGEEK